MHQTANNKTAQFNGLQVPLNHEAEWPTVRQQYPLDLQKQRRKDERIYFFLLLSNVQF